MTDEEQAKAAYAEAGVDLPELKEGDNKVTPEQQAADEAKAKTEADAKAKAESEAKAKEDEKANDDEPLQPAPKEEKKRSIYDEYKDKKSEAKSEKEARLKAEQERDALAEKLKAFSAAKTSKEKEDIKDDIETFAEEIDADPETIRKMRTFFLKDVKPTPGLSDEDRKVLADAKAISSANQKIADKQQFDDEYTKVAPTLKELFPNASSEELTKVKETLNTLAHTEGWHNKDLDYILFKNKDDLSALVSPKKRGIEGKGRKDVQADDSYEFDPNADYSKLSPKERDVWEAEYKKLGKDEGLVTDASGRKLLI